MKEIVLKAMRLLFLALPILVCLNKIVPAALKQSKSINSGKNVIVVYNRIPKCGSILMITLLQYCSDKFNRFELVRGKDRFHHRFTVEEQAKLAGSLITHTQKAGGHSVVYEQHMHFIKLNPKSNAVFWYINQIRDPLAHALSNYDFKRYRCFVHESSGACSQLHPSVRKLTMDECVSTGDPARCLTKPYGIGSMVSFFCGQESMCDDTKRRPNSSAALALAKSNIERFYLFVGLLEHMDSSLKLLEHIFPSFFAGIADVHRRHLKLAPVHVTPRKHRHQISNETRTVLLQLLKPEYELYEFVRQRFINQYRKIYGRAP